MILQNQIRCKTCDTVIYSAHRHDYQTCGCGKVSVDGGFDYLKRAGNIDDWEEQSVVIDDDLGWLLIEQITHNMGDRDAFAILSAMCAMLQEYNISNVLEAMANPDLV